VGKVVFTAAVMDLCHIGHINLLKKMRERASKGIVIVVLHSDQSCFRIKGKFPIQSLEHRTKNLLSTGLVDTVIHTYETEPVNEFRTIILKHGQSELLFMRGDDNKNFPAKQVIDTYEIPIEYIPYTKGVSSSSLREELL
jgi:glycerol-3-phosphate cytidylyltransferase